MGETSQSMIGDSGNDLESLKRLEEDLIILTQQFGLDSERVWQHCEELASTCNSLAMKFLREDNFDVASELLKKAEVLTEPSGVLGNNSARLRLRAITFNNFGCFFKRRGKLLAALQHLEKALKIEVMCPEADNPACTHLNLCAILSQLGRHEQAMTHANCALEILHMHQSPRRTESQKNEPPTSILGIAYHNLAVEQEFLGNQTGAIRSYERAYEVTSKQLGSTHTLTLAVKRSLENALEGTGRKFKPSKRPPKHTKSKTKKRPPSSTGARISTSIIPTAYSHMPIAGPLPRGYRVARDHSLYQGGTPRELFPRVPGAQQTTSDEESVKPRRPQSAPIRSTPVRKRSTSSLADTSIEHAVPVRGGESDKENPRRRPASARAHFSSTLTSDSDAQTTPRRPPSAPSTRRNVAPRPPVLSHDEHAAMLREKALQVQQEVIEDLKQQLAVAKQASAPKSEIAVQIDVVNEPSVSDASMLSRHISTSEDFGGMFPSAPTDALNMTESSYGEEDIEVTAHNEGASHPRAAIPSPIMRKIISLGSNIRDVYEHMSSQPSMETLSTASVRTTATPSIVPPLRLTQPVKPSSTNSADTSLSSTKSSPRPIAAKVTTIRDQASSPVPSAESPVIKSVLSSPRVEALKGNQTKPSVPSTASKERSQSPSLQKSATSPRLSSPITTSSSERPSSPLIKTPSSPRLSSAKSTPRSDTTPKPSPRVEPTSPKASPRVEQQQELSSVKPSPRIETPTVTKPSPRGTSATPTAELERKGSSPSLKSVPSPRNAGGDSHRSQTSQSSALKSTQSSPRLTATARSATQSPVQKPTVPPRASNLASPRSQTSLKSKSAAESPAPSPRVEEVASEPVEDNQTVRVEEIASDVVVEPVADSELSSRSAEISAADIQEQEAVVAESALLVPLDSSQVNSDVESDDGEVSDAIAVGISPDVSMDQVTVSEPVVTSGRPPFVPKLSLSNLTMPEPHEHPMLDSVRSRVSMSTTLSKSPQQENMSTVSEDGDPSLSVSNTMDSFAVAASQESPTQTPRLTIDGAQQEEDKTEAVLGTMDSFSENPGMEAEPFEPVSHVESPVPEDLNEQIAGDITQPNAVDEDIAPSNHSQELSNAVPEAVAEVVAQEEVALPSHRSETSMESSAPAEISQPLPPTRSVQSVLPVAPPPRLQPSTDVDQETTAEPSRSAPIPRSRSRSSSLAQELPPPIPLASQAVTTPEAQPSSDAAFQPAPRVLPSAPTTQMAQVASDAFPPKQPSIPRSRSNSNTSQQRPDITTTKLTAPEESRIAPSVPAQTIEPTRPAGTVTIVPQHTVSVLPTRPVVLPTRPVDSGSERAPPPRPRMAISQAVPNSSIPVLTSSQPSQQQPSQPSLPVNERSAARTTAPPQRQYLPSPSNQSQPPAPTLPTRPSSASHPISRPPPSFTPTQRQVPTFMMQETVPSHQQIPSQPTPLVPLVALQVERRPVPPSSQPPMQQRARPQSARSRLISPYREDHLEASTDFAALSQSSSHPMRQSGSNFVLPPPAPPSPIVNLLTHGFHSQLTVPSLEHSVNIGPQDSFIFEDNSNPYAARELGVPSPEQPRLRVQIDADMMLTPPSKARVPPVPRAIPRIPWSGNTSEHRTAPVPSLPEQPVAEVTKSPTRDSAILQTQLEYRAKRLQAYTDQAPQQSEKENRLDDEESPRKAALRIARSNLALRRKLALSEPSTKEMQVKPLIPFTM